MIDTFRDLLRIPTVSTRDPADLDHAAFDKLLAALRGHFPLLHTLPLIRVGSHGLLFHFVGAAADRPVVLMAHSGVVPAEGEWRPPTPNPPVRPVRDDQEAARVDSYPQQHITVDAHLKGVAWYRTLVESS